MANLISKVSGNLTSSIWALVEAISLLDSEAANTLLTTSYVESQAFTPGAVTIDGIAVKLAARAASPTGTFSVRLAQAGVLVAGTEITINVSDLHLCDVAQNDGGWVFFKFAAPVTLSAATAYTLSAKTSSASQVTLYRDATAGNWSRQLRTTTTQNAIAGDVLHAMGEHTGQATGNDITVTHDSTATTDYGAGVDGLPALTTNRRSIFTCAGAAATNYYLKLSGHLITYGGSIVNFGSPGAEIPRSSTSIVELDPVAAAGMAFLFRGGTINIYGLSRTAGKNIVKSKLNGDLVAGNTNINIVEDTGWLNGDLVLFPATRKTALATNESEFATLSADAGASSFNIASGLANLHYGVDQTIGDVVLLTRNVMFRTTNSARQAYVIVGSRAVVNIEWADFRYFGTSNASFWAFVVNTSTAGGGSFRLDYCTVRDCERRIMNLATVGNATVRNNVFSLNGSTGHDASRFNMSNTSLIFENNFINRAGFSGGANGNTVFLMASSPASFINNIVTDSIDGGCAILINVGLSATDWSAEVYGGRNNGGIALLNNLSSRLGGSIKNFKVWNANGIVLNQIEQDLTISNCILTGNGTNLTLGGGGYNVIVKDSILSGNSKINTTTNLNLQGIAAEINLINCTFSLATTGYAIATNDITISANASISALLTNCIFNGTNFVINNSNLTLSSLLKFENLNQIANNHMWFSKYGSARSTGAGLIDTLVRTAGSLGLRLAPANSVDGMSFSYQVLAKAGSSVYANGFLRKSAAMASDLVTVELFLPGSTVADATYTMSNVADNWEAFVVNASYIGAIDLYATVKITAKTVAAGGYLYIDDLYNGTNKITALDVWENGQPSPIMFEQLGDAAAIWSVAQAAANVDGTVGSKLNSLLELAEFIALK